MDSITDLQQVYNQVISGNLDIVDDLNIDDIKMIIKTLVKSFTKGRELNSCIADIHINLLNQIHEAHKKTIREQEEEEKLKRRQAEMASLY